MNMLVAQSCPTLCNPKDCSPPGSSVHGILQARILEWVAIPFSRGSSSSRDWTQVSCIAGRFFTIYTAVQILWARESKVLWVNFRVPFKSIFHHIFARENATKAASMMLLILNYQNFHLLHMASLISRTWQEKAAWTMIYRSPTLYFRGHLIIWNGVMRDANKAWLYVYNFKIRQLSWIKNC